MATTDTKLYVALGVLALLGGALYLTNKSNQAEEAHYSVGARAATLPKLQITDDDASKVNKIVLKKAGGGDAGPPVEVTLVKQGEEWQLDQPVKALANQANVKSLVDNLKSLKVSEAIDPAKTSYSKYGVADDQGVHAVFHKDNGVVLDAHFGQSGGRGQMTRLAGHDGVFAINGYSSYLYDRDVKGWRDLTLFKFEEVDVASVNIDNENGSFVFTKEGENWTGKHKKAKGGALAPLAKFEASKVPDLLRAYKGLNADGFADATKQPADLGLDKPTATLTFTLKDGAKREVKVGSSAEGSGRWVQVSGKPELYSISSWAADWATADEKKFQKSDDAKPGEQPDTGGGMPHGMPGMPGMQGMPHGVPPTE
jgi:hypothetical protein